MAEAPRRFPYVVTVLLIPILGLLIALGVWQVQRLHWKEGLIAQSEAAAAQRPALLADVLTAPDPEFRKALVVCRGLPTAPYVELQSIHDGAPGSRLISACTPEGMDQTFLIDRGFLSETISMRPRVMASTLPLSVVVELRRSPQPNGMTPPPSGNHFYGRDNAAIARALGAGTPSEFTLFALTSPNPEAPLIVSAPPAAFSNNHLGYALTWFGLAIALVGFYVAALFRRVRKPIP